MTLATRYRHPKTKYDFLNSKVKSYYVPSTTIIAELISMTKPRLFLLGNMLREHEGKIIKAENKITVKGGEKYVPKTENSFTGKLDVAILDIERISAIKEFIDAPIRSKEEIIRFMSMYYPMIQNYVITKSKSNIELGDTSKWHIYIPLGAAYATNKVKQWFLSKLPKDGFVIGINKNGAKNYGNIYFDEAVFQASRIMFEHKEAYKHVEIIGNGKYNNLKEIDKTTFLRPEGKQLFTDAERNNRLKVSEKRGAKKRNISVAAFRKLKESGSILDPHTTQVMISDGTMHYLDKLPKKKNTRCYPFLDEGIEDYKQAMNYDGDGELRDYHNEISYVVSDSDGIYHHKLKKDGKLTDIKDWKKTLPKGKVSSLASPTGSGKTFLFKKRNPFKHEKSVFLVPTNSLVRENKGVKAGQQLRLREGKSRVITYAKFIGHYEYNPHQFDDVNLIMDETHFFAEHKSQDLHKLFKIIFNIKRPLARTILLSGTMPNALLNTDIEHHVKQKGSKKIIQPVALGKKQLRQFIAGLEGRTLVIQNDALANHALAKSFKDDDFIVDVLDKDHHIENKEANAILATSFVSTGVNLAPFDNIVIEDRTFNISPAERMQIFGRDRTGEANLYMIQTPARHMLYVADTVEALDRDGRLEYIGSLKNSCVVFAPPLYGKSTNLSYIPQHIDVLGSGAKVDEVIIFNDYVKKKEGLAYNPREIATIIEQYPQSYITIFTSKKYVAKTYKKPAPYPRWKKAAHHMLKNINSDKYLHMFEKSELNTLLANSILGGEPSEQTLLRYYSHEVQGKYLNSDFKAFEVHANQWVKTEFLTPLTLDVDEDEVNVYRAKDLLCQHGEFKYKERSKHNPTLQRKCDELIAEKDVFIGGDQFELDDYETLWTEEGILTKFKKFKSVLGVFPRINEDTDINIRSLLKHYKNKTGITIETQKMKDELSAAYVIGDVSKYKIYIVEPLFHLVPFSPFSNEEGNVYPS